MKIYVCVKHVPDSAAKITILGKQHIDESITFIMNPYDENAVEEAVRLKKQVSDAEVIAVTLGKESAEATLRSALAMGADRGILIKTNESPDSLITASVLKAAILQDGQPDIIFTGKVSIDSEGLQTMYRLSAALHMPVASNVLAFSWMRDRVLVECGIEAGARAVMELRLPCVIGAGKGLNKPSYPTLPAILKAKKKQVKQLDVHALDLEKPSGSLEILEFKPAVEKRKATELKGDPQEIARKLIRILHEEAKVLEKPA